ncbi:hypothetical protein J6590_099862 [Homalodisca vitripennis]|nr:hypothetical protein J6590_099862 [Homalodisca vitripennis]
MGTSELDKPRPRCPLDRPVRVTTCRMLLTTGHGHFPRFCMITERVRKGQQPKSKLKVSKHLPGQVGVRQSTCKVPFGADYVLNVRRRRPLLLCLIDKVMSLCCASLIDQVMSLCCASLIDQVMSLCCASLIDQVMSLCCASLIDQVMSLCCASLIDQVMFLCCASLIDQVMSLCCASLIDQVMSLCCASLVVNSQRPASIQRLCSHSHYPLNGPPTQRLQTGERWSRAKYMERKRRQTCSTWKSQLSDLAL